MQLDMWTLAGFILTLMVFSYLFGDNFLFRVATYIFIGVSAAYVCVIVIYQIILPRLLLPLVIGSTSERTMMFFPLVMSVLLLFKLSSRFSNLGNLSMGYLTGLAAAVTVGGAVLGTLAGQVGASFHFLEDSQGTLPSLALLEGAFVLLGTIATLVYFHFGAQQNAARKPRRVWVVEGAAGIGQIFIAVTLGALFAGVLTASITALVERLSFIIRCLMILL